MHIYMYSVDSSGLVLSDLFSPSPEQVESLLLHPHAWVRLSSCQLFGHLFAAYQPGDLVPGGAAEPAASEEREEEERRGGGGRKRKRKSVGGMAEDVAPEYLLKEPAQKVRLLETE